MEMSHVYEIKTTALSRCNAPAHQISASIIGLTFGAIGALISITAILFGATHGGGAALYALLSAFFTGIGILLGILQIRPFILAFGPCAHWPVLFYFQGMCFYPSRSMFLNICRMNQE